MAEKRNYPASLKAVVRIFKALADPTRLRVVLLLLRRELCVCEIMFVLDMEQSRVSHHMRILREAGIVEDIRQGRWIIYRISAEARPFVEDLLAGALRERIEGSPETAQDTCKLDASIRLNIRARVCETSRAETVRGARGKDNHG
ncbi:MAG: metalloregulator ArsR/SmtB family transcription factor [Candidatus Aminicenantales bacterium]